MTSGPPRRPTIRDVAATAGVSITTVSHSLNNKGRVDPDTRQRVIAAAERLGYRPSPAARSLRDGRSGIVTLLLPPLGTERRSNQALALDIYMRMSIAAASAAHAHGRGLLLLPPVQTTKDVRHAAIDGAVVADPGVHDRRLDVLSELDLPYVTIERDMGRPPDPWHVSLDVVRGFEAVFTHLRSQGATNVCLLASDADWAYSVTAIEAFLQLAASHAMEARVVPVPVLPLEGAAHDAARGALQADPPPEAVIALVERFALAVVRAAEDKGLRIPEDLLVVSGADSYHVRESDPAITALDMQPEAAAGAAVEMLIGRLEGTEVEAPRVIDYPLRIRASSRRA